MLSRQLSLACAAILATSSPYALAKSPVSVAPEAPAVEAPAEDKMIIDYQINKQANSVVISNPEKPFTAFKTIMEQTLLAAKTQPGVLINTLIMLPYPEDMVSTVKTKLPNLELKTTVSADKTGKTEYAIKAFKSDIKENQSVGILDWKGLQGSVQYAEGFNAPSGDFTAAGLLIKVEKEFEFSFSDLALSASFNEYDEPLKFNFSLPKINFDSEDTKLTVDNISSSLDLHELADLDGLAVGTADLKLNQMTATMEGETASLSGFDLQAESKRTDPSKTLINSGVHLKIADIQIPESLNPGGFSQMSFNMDLLLSNLEGTVFAELQKTLRNLKAQGMNEDMMGLAVMGQVMQSAPQLLQVSPKIDLSNLSLHTNNGNADANLKISFDGSQPLKMDKLELLKKLLSAEAHIKLDKSLVNTILMEQLKAELPAAGSPEAAQAPKAEELVKMQIEAFIEQKFIVDAGEHYTIDAQFKDSKLMLNGEYFPLPF
jgi:uncharacterized protein YdgA (DUF945 family)